MIHISHKILLGILIVIVVVSLIVGIIWMNSIGKHNFGTYEYVTSLMVGLLVTAGIFFGIEFNINPWQVTQTLFWMNISILFVIFSITGIVAASLMSQSQLIWVIATIIWLMIILGILVLLNSFKYWE